MNHYKKIGTFTLPETQSSWLELPWPAALISSASLGDLGPGGMDSGGAARRYFAYSSIIGPEPAPSHTNVLLCKQTHSLRMLCFASGRSFLTEGIWEPQDGIGLSISFTEVKASSTGNEAIPEASVLQEESRRATLSVAEDLNLASSTEADALISDNPAHALSVTVADCMPIFVRSKRYRAAIHSGWGGTGILAVALKAFERLGETEIEVLSGPCIAAEHYAVPPGRANLFAARFGVDAVKPCADGQPGIDMTAANRAILEWTAPCLEGLQKPRLSWAWTYCTDSTFSDPRLQSYRRDGGTPRYGRMLAVFGPSV